MDADWRSELDEWLTPFVAALRHKTRSRMCPAYIAGLIGPGDRKSIEPIAARDDDVSYDRLHHFIASGVWDEEPLEAALLAEADRQVGGDDAWLIIDDTALPRKAVIRLAWHRNMPRLWARTRTARRWCLQRWHQARCLS
jgi:SRSO17 transposase